MIMLINFGAASTLLSLVAVTFVSCSRSENATSARQQLVQKHFKRLKKLEGAIKLVGGRDESEGNVEIFHNGKWGNVCDDEWDKYEADVVCKQLSYHLGGKATHSGAFGKARRKYWMDNLFCTGEEKELGECRFDGWGNSDCDHTEAAGVVCSVEKVPEKIETKVKQPKVLYKAKDAMEVRLVGGRIPEEGRVEVKFGDGPYGDICADGWSLLEASTLR